MDQVRREQLGMLLENVRDLPISPEYEEMNIKSEIKLNNPSKCRSAWRLLEYDDVQR